MAVTAFRKALTKGEVREIIEFRHKALKDEATKIDNARRESKAEGIAEGEAKGLIKSAKIMLELGHSKAEIASKLGLNESDF